MSNHSPESSHFFLICQEHARGSGQNVLGCDSAPAALVEDSCEGGQLVAGGDEVLVHAPVGVDHASRQVGGFELAAGVGSVELHHLPKQHKQMRTVKGAESVRG